MNHLRNLSCLLLITASISSASVLQTYNDRPSWEAATNAGFTLVDFEDLNLPLGYFNYSTVSGLLSDGVTFVGVQNAPGIPYYLWASTPGVGDPAYANSGTLLVGPEYRGGNGYLSVTLPSAVTSFGLDLMSMDPVAQSFRILLDDIDVGITITTVAQPSRQFFGVTTDTPISAVRIVFNGDPTTTSITSGRFDNFVYGSASTGGTTGGSGTGGGPEAETPEAGTLLCLGSGLLMFRWVKRRGHPLATPA